MPSPVATVKFKALPGRRFEMLPAHDKWSCGPSERRASCVFMHEEKPACGETGAFDLCHCDGGRYFKEIPNA